MLTEDEKREFLRSHGWVEIADGRWHRVGEHPDTSTGLYTAFKSVGSLDEHEREMLFESGWVLGADETWAHPDAGNVAGISGASALVVHAAAIRQVQEDHQKALESAGSRLGQGSTAYKEAFAANLAKAAKRLR